MNSQPNVLDQPINNPVLSGEPLPRPAENIRVFIVEDSRALQERLNDALADIEHVKVIGLAESEREAIQYIANQNPDVIIVDIQLREGNGINVLNYIKRQRYLSKVIVLTNYAFPQYYKKCKEMGADYFFDKSTEFMKVPEVLQSLERECRTSSGVGRRLSA